MSNIAETLCLTFMACLTSSGANAMPASPFYLESRSSDARALIELVMWDVGDSCKQGILTAVT